MDAISAFQALGGTISVGQNPAASGMRLDSKEAIASYARHMVGYRQDAGAPVAFARQLETTLAKTYEARFARYRAKEFFPMSTEIEPGAMSWNYRMYSRVGQAAVIANSALGRNLPNIDVEGQENPFPVITLGASYQWSVIDEAAGRKANFALEAAKGRACRQAFEALEEQIYCQGWAPAGIYGVTNAPGIAGVKQVSTGTWTAQFLASAAPSSSQPFPYTAFVAAVLSDLSAMKVAISTLTEDSQEATNGLLPLNLYNLLETTPQSPAFNGLSALAFVESILGIDLDKWTILGSAGNIAGSPATISGGAGLMGRVLVYDKDPEVLQLMQAQTFTQLAPQPVGLGYVIPCFSRTGGVMSPYPLGAGWMDGL